MSICKFYKVETKRFIDPQKRSTLDVRFLLPFKIEWCEHSDSALKKNEKGEIGKDSRCPLKTTK